MIRRKVDILTEKVDKVAYILHKSDDDNNRRMIWYEFDCLQF